MENPIWQIQYGSGPLVAAAIHDGDEVRPELQDWLEISATHRLREEDPFTGIWTSIAPTRVVGLRSRFEMDLNRPRDRAVYRTPADCWGLSVWRRPLPEDVVNRSLAAYDAFYLHLGQLLENLVRHHDRVVVIDLHSYNHRRGGPEGPIADAEANPEINIGTGTMDRRYWSAVVDRWIDGLRSFNYRGRHLDVRENVKFQGGNFPRWIHEHFPRSVCAIAVEVKKFFMDEWTGRADNDHLHAVGQALRSAAAGVLEELERFEPPTAN